MSAKAKYVIFETQEVFDSREDLAKELGLSKATIDYYLYPPKPRHGLHFYSIPDNEQICIRCGVSLTSDNQHAFNKRDGYRICKKCQRKQSAKGQVKYRANNPFADRIKSFRHHYNSDITVEDFKSIWKTQGGKCRLCKANLDENQYHIDHIIPYSKCGVSKVSNLQLLCEMCNRGKFNWTTEEYIEHCKKVAIGTA